jgi:uncharacterized protein (DUF1501 family)
MNRRKFMVGCSTAIAAMAGAQITSLTLANPETQGDTLVVVFLRGGWDALNVMPPIDGKDRGYYEAARPFLKIPTSGKGAALKLTDAFGLHPAMEPLLELYQGRQLALVQATGMASDTRSHFDAMQFMELGTPGERSTTTGWITRHLQAAPLTQTRLSSLSMDSAVAPSVLGSPSAVAMKDPKSFSLVDDADHRKRLINLLGSMYQGDTWIHAAGQRTLATLKVLEQLKPKDNPAPYPKEEFSERLKTLAALLKQGLSLRVATVDLGGWDTHEYQGERSEGHFANLLAQLSGGLTAFYKDLDKAGLTRRLSVVVMSEFGRRLSENASRGTDHGHGSAMMVLGGGVNGGKIYGSWPGLSPDQLYDRADLAATTDYRQVLGELLRFRQQNQRLDVVFPGFKPQGSLGIVRPS